MKQITVLGGSSVSTPGLVLALRDLAPDGEIHVQLHGRSPKKLELVYKACQFAASGTSITVDHHTDLAKCLDGADVILNQVRVGGLEGRKFDEQFPPILGLLGEETIGAGGFSNALRTIPVVLDICEVIRQRAPTATIVNLTNPASLVHQAISRFAGLDIISICDIPVTLGLWVHQALDAPAGSIEVDYLGTNHMGWVTAARDLRAGGNDRLDDVLANIQDIPRYPFDADWVRALGVMPGMYLRYIYDRTWSPAQDPQGRTRADELLEIEVKMLQAYGQMPSDAQSVQVAQILSMRSPHWYAEIVAPLVDSLVSARSRRLIVQMTNEGRVPGLEYESVVEAPAIVTDSEIALEAPVPLPRDCHALLVQNAVYEGLAVESIVERDRGKAIRALTINPLVGIVDQAKAVLDEVWPW